MKLNLFRINTLKYLFSPRQQQKTMTANKTDWETLLDLRPQLNWQASEYELIDTFIQRGTWVDVSVEGRHCHQSVLLNMDPELGALTLDEIFPNVALKHLKSPVVTLKLQLRRQTLVLKARLKQLPNFQVRADLLEKHWFDDRRINARVEFLPLNAPDLELLIPMQARLQAKLVNLSTDGMAIRILGQSLKHLKGLQGECKLFNHHGLDIKLKTDIRQVQHKQRGCQYNTLRLRFVDMQAPEDELLLSLVNTFIDRKTSRQGEEVA